MLRDEYPADPLFMFILELTAIPIDPELVEMDRIVEDDAIFQLVWHDLSQRHPQTLLTGRNSTPVKVIIRQLALKHLYDWSYADTCRFVSDSLVLRWFCRVYFHPVCADKTLLRWANLIQPETLRLWAACRWASDLLTGKLVLSYPCHGVAATWWSSPRALPWPRGFFMYA